MPVLLILVAAALIGWIVRPSLKHMDAGRKRTLLIMLVGGGLALLFLFKGKAVLSAFAALGAVAMKFAYSPFFRPALGMLMSCLPGVIGTNARNARRQEKHQKQEKEADEAASTLNISKDADADAVQHAYIAYMKVHHPDKGGSEDAAKRGARARDILLARIHAQKQTDA